MKRSWLLALGVAALMSAICVYWWSVGRNKWRPPPPLKPDLPELIALPVPSQVKATQAKERPLFWAARRPAASASAQADAKTGVESELAQSRLGLPKSLTGVFQGLLLFTLLACDTLIAYRVRWVRVAGAKAGG